jgi:5-methylcytosine-specific restriction endonuclease McrA
MKRDKRLCYLCGRYVLPSDASRDHLVPKSVGGSDSLSNLALAHKDCNAARGVTPVSVMVKRGKPPRRLVLAPA